MGRLSAALAAAACVARSCAGPWWAQVVGAVGPIHPWIINRSMTFNARTTSWRNVRWHGGYWGVAKICLFRPLAAVLTLGILAPAAARRVRERLADRCAFGRERFAAATPLRPYYRAFAKARALGTAVLALLLTTITARQVALFGSRERSWGRFRRRPRRIPAGRLGPVRPGGVFPDRRPKHSGQRADLRRRRAVSFGGHPAPVRPDPGHQFPRGRFRRHAAVSVGARSAIPPGRMHRGHASCG